MGNDIAGMANPRSPVQPAGIAATLAEEALGSVSSAHFPAKTGSDCYRPGWDEGRLTFHGFNQGARIARINRRRTMARKKSRKPSTSRGAKKTSDHSTARCGLCGNTKNLIRTECCGNWICDDEDEYVLFSYARNSCSRNHRRYTVCGFHFSEGHPGRWQDCQKCRDSAEPELYVYHATNEYNFEVLQNPPDFEPTRCAGCGRVIDLVAGGYSLNRRGYWCGSCTDDPIRERR